LDDRADLRLLRSHLLGCEPFVDELAPLPVDGVVLLDHHPGRTAVGADAAGARPQVRVLRDLLDVVVLGDAPDAAGVVPTDGVVRPEPGQGGVRVTAPEVTADEIQIRGRAQGTSVHLVVSAPSDPFAGAEAPANGCAYGED